jgi:hypothetical protein
MRFLGVEDVRSRLDLLEAIQGYEFNAALICGQEQHKVDALCEALANTTADLQRLPRERYNRARRGLTTRVKQQEREVEKAFEILQRHLQRLQYWTFLRLHVECGVRHNNKEKRQRGEELSKEEIAAEQKLTVGEPYAVHDYRWERRIGYFELDRSVNPRALVWERLEGSVLFMFE